MAYSGNKGLVRLMKAVQYSWKGFKSAFKHEEAFRQELILVVVLSPLGYWLGENGVERALLIGCLLLVLIVELLNSAVEAAIDRFGAEIHKLSGRAKDMGSAAVLLSLVNVLIIWLLVLVP